jgi:hypothetical protein
MTEIQATDQTRDPTDPNGSQQSKDDTIRVRTGMLWGEVMRVLWEKNKARLSRLVMNF